LSSTTINFKPIEAARDENIKSQLVEVELVPWLGDCKLIFCYQVYFFKYCACWKVITVTAVHGI